MDLNQDDQPASGYQAGYTSAGLQLLASPPRRGGTGMCSGVMSLKRRVFSVWCAEDQSMAVLGVLATLLGVQAASCLHRARQVLWLMCSVCPTSPT